ncbi:MAG: protein kinase [Anaerolineales bacterium]|nr:protein kinase [Chloroflexota bacterium]MBL6983061.1 protein kinase [Anaerolineales bacterium]MBL7163982.1 protein kinase [Anaerolineales bacterium]
MASLSGKTLGKYQITERLGRGGMAEVYKAYHPQLERYAAVKVLHGFLAEGQDFQARFQREAKAIAALRHPNIVQIYDIDTDEDNYYMVMEFIDGGTLKDRLIQSSGPLTIQEMAHIFREIASALDYAHRQGVLHRDIKPANVLLDDSGRVVLTDFGIARIVSETQFTVTGTLVGTPAYMSPEQGKGMPIASSSDIYSLGIILYEMVTGKVPFDADTPLAVIHKHINEPLPSPRTIRDDIPRVLEAVIVKALAKEAEDRYQSAAEMVDAAENAFLDFAKVTMAETMFDPPDPSTSSVETQPDLEAAPAPEPTIASKATVAMEPDDEPKPTVAMKPEDEDIAIKATVAMEPEPSPKPPVVKPIPKPKPKTIPKPKPKVKVKPLPIILSIVGLAVIAAFLVWGIPKLSGSGGGADCTSIDECQALAEERWGTGDIEGVIIALETALGYVPNNEHPPNAHLWCQKGEALVAMVRFEEAVSSFEDCMNWTEDNPDLEDIRNFAQVQIESLPTGSSECGSPEECHGLAEELRNNGDIQGALEAINTAIHLVPEGEYLAFHYIVCLEGELYNQDGDWEEAIRSFESCIEWTEGDPGLEDVRIYAQEQIDMINNR